MTPIALSYVTRTLASSRSASGNRDAFAVWSPRERVYHALTHDGTNAALYRIADAVTIVAAGAAALGLPAGALAHALLVGADDVLRVIVGAHGEPARLLRFDGERFAAEALALPAIAADDALAWDAAGRRVLHVEAATGRVRALREGGVTELGALDEAARGGRLSSASAVWDAARAALVVIAHVPAQGPVTLVFADGATTVIPGVPGVGRHDSRFPGHRLVAEPKTGRAMLLFRPGESSRPDVGPTPPQVLGHGGWAASACEPAPAAAAYAGGDGELLALAPGRVPTRVETPTSNVAVRREFGVFDGATWSLRGRVIPLCQALLIGPDGPVAQLAGNVLAALVEGELVPRPPVEDLQAILAAPGRVVAIGPGGTASPASKAALVWHPGLDAALAIGGEEAGKTTQVTRALRDGAWTELKTKGKPHKQYAGLAAHDPTRGVVVLAGGFAKDRFMTVTSEFDGKAWTTFDAELPWDSVPDAKLLARDPATGHLFAAIATPSGWDRKDERFGLDLYRYDGEGRWTRAGELRFAAPGSGGFQTTLGGFAAAYDPASRSLICAGPVDDGSGTCGVLRAELGALIDAWPQRGQAEAPAQAQAKAPAQEAASAPRRALVMKEDGASKFWIAELAGDSWTARWGRRGSDGQTKTYAFDSADKAAKDYAKKVREKLDKGYRDAPAGDDPSRLAGRDAYDMKFGKAKAGADQIFGVAPIDVSLRPVCRGCGEPLALLAVLRRHDERLPLSRWGALAVFQCERVECKPWDPGAGANRVLLLRAEDLAAKPPAGAAERPAQAIAYAKPRFELDPEKEEVEEPPTSRCKLGGFPTWVQSPELPACDECKQSMRFVAQFEGNDVGMNFGDIGVGYLFLCPDEHQGKFLSQSS